MQSLRSLPATISLAALVAVSGIAAPAPSNPVFAGFLQQLNQLVKLHEGVPRLKTTPKPQDIADRRQLLVQKIREARASAKPGDIFIPPVSDEFRRLIGIAFQGSRAPGVRRTIRQGEPLKGWHLAVNGDYPARIPATTIPPTLLQDLPQLPAEVEYRIVGHDFVLLDTQAMLILDFITGVVP